MEAFVTVHYADGGTGSLLSLRERAASVALADWLIRMKSSSTAKAGFLWHAAESLNGFNEDGLSAGPLCPGNGCGAWARGHGPSGDQSPLKGGR